MLAHSFPPSSRKVDFFFFFPKELSISWRTFFQHPVNCFMTLLASSFLPVICYFFSSFRGDGMKLRFRGWEQSLRYVQGLTWIAEWQIVASWMENFFFAESLRNRIHGRRVIAMKFHRFCEAWITLMGSGWSTLAWVSFVEEPSRGLELQCHGDKTCYGLECCGSFW